MHQGAIGGRVAMKITLIQRYFWPESVLTNDVARWLVARGHAVDVITAQPSYHPEARLPRQPWISQHEGALIRRVPLFNETRGLSRQINGLLFVIQAFLLIVFSKGRDVYWTTTMPPISQALAIRIASWMKGGKFIYFVQDIHPEIAVAVGLLRPGALSRVMTRIDAWTMTKADATVVHTTDMANAVRRRGARPKLMPLINNFAPVDAAPISRSPRTGPARFIYAGNIGRFQNLEAVLRIFASIDPNQATLLLLGAGRLTNDLLKLAPENVTFQEIVPQEEAFEIIGSCDVGIVSLKEGLISYAYPGKTFAYLSAGLPVLAFVEPETELGRDLRERRIGRAIGWSSSESELKAAVTEIARERYHPGEIRDRARGMYDPQIAREKWIRAFEQVGMTDRQS